MSAEEYWDGDPQWAKAYREAERIKTDKLNQQLWLGGMYVYDALCRASPILHAFAPSGTKPHPYPEAPYPLTADDAERIEQEKQERAMREAQKYMEQFAIQWQEVN